jgi:transposase
MNTRIIGIDLAVTAAHKAIVLDQTSNSYVSRLISFRTDPAEIERVIQAAQADAPEEVRVVAVLEATGMSWFTVGSYLERQGVEVYRVSGQKTADQRRVYNRYAKADRIDARVLARLFLTVPDRLHRLWIPTGSHLALQRACRERARLKQQIAAIKNRLLATDNFAWLDLCSILSPYETPARWVRSHWYNPWRVLEADQQALVIAWQAEYPHFASEIAWVPALLEKAKQVTLLYGDASWIDYEALQASLRREQARLAALEQQEHHLRLKVIRPLYRQFHPSRNLETLQGVGQDSAAIFIAFIGNIQRFPTINNFRGWSGMIPYSSQSGFAQAKGLHITQAGPDLIKATAFLDASVARLWDPQMAAIYYEQMMFKGKHHLQAICACATHLLNRIYAVLRDDRPYELQDVDGTPVTRAQARWICQQRYTVPEEIRRQNNYRVRTARAERKVEQRYLSRLHIQRSKG